MRRVRIPRLAYLAVVLLALLPDSLHSLTPDAVHVIPYFARRYNVTCAHCHASPPRLNAFGEAFVAAGYRSPELQPRSTWPLAVWMSGRAESLPAGGPLEGEVKSYINRVELISGGELVVPWLSYFVEWRAVSFEARGDGSTRDRSGRFEDLFVTAGSGAFDVTAGQFRMMSQVDVSRRVGLAEPLVFSASLSDPRDGGGTDRQRGLRAFSPAARSPAVRGAWHRPLGAGTWTSTLTLPVPGELSIPLTREARTEASNELEWRLKGVFVESYYRRALFSVGVHGFYDDSDRHLVTGVLTGQGADLHWTLALGMDRSGAVTRGRWSVEGEYIPRSAFAAGSRIEGRAADGAGVAFIPYVNTHYPGTSFTVRFTLEQRFQRGRQATFLEVGTIF